MVILHVHSDDHTYVYGDMECKVDENGKPIEPYIYKEEGRMVECYVSEHLYIEKENNEITKVVHIGTCCSDDYDIDYDEVFDENGKPIEPYIYKEEERTVECYVSEHLYIEKKNNEITRVVHTSTCWSDDYDKYDIEDGEVVYLETTEHGMNRAYITYENGVISDIKYAHRVFGCYAVGDLAPMLKELI
jgi:hypothetical protein